MKKFKISGLVLLLTSFFSLPSASAHEVYVLSKEQFAQGMADHSLNVLSSLYDPHNLPLVIAIIVGGVIVFGSNFLFRRSRYGRKVQHAFELLRIFAPLIVRIAVAIVLFFSALLWRFLGPEISLSFFPLASALRILLFVASGLIFIGFLTELAALVCLFIFSLALHVFGFYMLSYLVYLVEFAILFLFGAPKFSLDAKIFTRSHRFDFLEKYADSALRISYGLSLMFAAVWIKFLHPAVPLAVVNTFHLTQFHYLFPSDPNLVVIGATIVEFALAFFIIVGFELRLTVLISLFYLTLSLFYFQEAMWPHLILYAMSFFILFSTDKYTLDSRLLAQAS